MTVVAAYTHGEHIYLFGDLLLSDKRADKSSIELPASGRNPDLRPDGSRMSELRQKIVVIAPYCALGFAGDFQNAQKLLQILKSKAMTSVRLSYAEVLAEIKIASFAATDERYEIAVVGWYRNVDGTCQSLSASATHHKHARGGDILVAGTGSDLFLDAFDWTIRESEAFTSPLPRFDPKIHWLFLQAALIGNEEFLRQEAGTLARLVGGGYELIALKEDGFYKVDDLTVVLWEAFCSFKGRPKYRYHAFLAYKMTYVRDALVLRVCSVGGKEWDDCDFPARNVSYVALPPYYDPPQPFPDEVESVQLDSQAVCHVVFVTLEDQWQGFFMDVDFGSEKGHCKDVLFTYPGFEGRKSFRCEISENRKQAFEKGILSLVVDQPDLPFPV